MINFAFFLHPLEPVIFHFYVLFLVTTHLDICVSTVILAIQLQLPDSEVLASFSAEFVCCVINSLPPSLPVVQLFTNIKHTGKILFKFVTFHSFTFIIRLMHIIIQNLEIKI